MGTVEGIRPRILGDALCSTFKTAIPALVSISDGHLPYHYSIVRSIIFGSLFLCIRDH
jgi:hypothetical protein